MKLVITIKNFPEERYYLEKLSLMIVRLWRLDFGRNLEDVECKMEEDDVVETSCGVWRNGVKS